MEASSFGYGIWKTLGMTNTHEELVEGGAFVVVANMAAGQYEAIVTTSASKPTPKLDLNMLLKK